MEKIEVIQAFNYITKAWSEISTATIKNCFHKAGFRADLFLGECSSNSDEETDHKEMQNLWNNIKKTETGYDFSYFEYVHIDTDLKCFETYSTEEIVESKQQENNQNISDDEDATITEILDANTANEALKKLLIYFQSNNEDCLKHIDNLMKMSDFISTQNQMF